MKIETTKPVGEIAVEFPRSIPLFQEKGIDYCCAGTKSLQEACASVGVSAQEVAQSIEEMGNGDGTPGTPARWNSLLALMDHILKKHHVYTKGQLNLLAELSAKVRRVHGEKHQELQEVDALVTAMKTELEHHMAKEEQIAFPYLARLEEAFEQGSPQEVPFPYSFFKNGPRQCLLQEHEGTGEQLRRLRRLTGNFKPPAGACVSYQAFYHALKELEEDIHQHIHLENNVLFPMAEALAGEEAAF